ncbi:MAG: cytochrome c [Candidatus Sumerlaeia bacterium]|nr:cytochrome c [Candidatus Sumerlaeia bacterium]
MASRTRTKLLAAVAAAGLLAGCRDNPERRELTYMPEMYYSPAVKSQESTTFFADGTGSRHAPQGAIPRDWDFYPLAWNQLEEADKLSNPLPRTAEVLEAGRRYYNVYCIACHNYNGNGMTPVTMPGRMPVPPVLYSDKIQNEWPDGRVFHTITHGQGNMPGYADKLTPEKRWAVVHYVRALYVAANPTEEQLAAFQAAGGTTLNDDPRVAPSAPPRFPAQ